VTAALSERPAALALLRLAMGAAALGVWELLPRTGVVDPMLLPPPSVVFPALVTMLGRAPIRSDLLVTGAEIAVAFLISVPVGALIGVLLAEDERLGAIFNPLLFFLFGIPKSIFLPLFILIMGIGFWQKVSFGIFSTVLIVILSAASAVRSVRPEHLTVARSYGATRAQIIARVYIPSMLPILLEALRIAIIFTFTAVILAEMYASRTGIGHQIAGWGENFMMPSLLAGVVALSVIAVVINEAIRMIEHRCSAWRT
jgi:NitT/TauT family transport system permease protein